MRVLVLGKTGQVACELAAFDGVTCLSRSDADLSDPSACAKAIRDHVPEAVINAAAYTAVDLCEDEEALARVINGEAPAVMATVCSELDIPFVHISTDYVFDGAGAQRFLPNDPVRPINAYGRTKCVGEQGVAQAGGRFCILRTSWVFSAHGSNFLKTMMRLSQTRDALSVVCDQIGGPTPARAIAQACMQIAERLRTDGASLSGVQHFSGAPDTSWADFARRIFETADRAVLVSDIPTSEYPTPAPRPLNSRLDCSGLERDFGIERPDWRAAVKQVLAELDVQEIAE